ncbi:O-antigen ligase [Polynucleobacter sp. AP-Nino-20-G2]|uniref:O-antigen ligase family protein n=1 Tax=Polynucleobacter sp. AP-Nino-20-G2 TaxID=2576917 RepID=UPI001BFDFADF|nr:O-antigen ligase family protein [Polynucleobacter sp. AP-Nino-20-G2]QWE16886.1 O-antigen ligase family protein [Polynucleobacter sp. AP-Nino-20-G2]
MVSSKSNMYLGNILLIMLSILPLCLFSVKGWTSAILFIGSALAFALVFTNSSDKLLDRKQSTWIILIMLMFASPLMAAMLSSALRGEWDWSSFDSFSRFLLAIPIFYIVYRNHLKVVNQWQYLIPVSLIFTLLSTTFLPGYNGDENPFDHPRLAIFFVDPLTLGYLSLTLGVLSFFSINMYARDNWKTLLLKILGGMIGFYISFRTQSRTGWLAIPLILFLLLYTRGPKNRLLSTLAAIAISAVIATGIYLSSSTVQNRIHDAVVDLRVYKFNDLNSETSIGERISFARMGLYYFKLSPVRGWGLRGFQEHANDPELLEFASESTRASPARGSLFHSEITTNAVAHGIFGLAAMLLLFFLPVILCVRQWRKGVNPRLCAFGLAYLFCVIISGLSTEIFSLKFTASFHSVFLACLCAQLLAEEGSSADADSVRSHG